MEIKDFKTEEIVEAVKQLNSQLKVNKEMFLTALTDFDKKWHSDRAVQIQARIKELEESLNG